MRAQKHFGKLTSLPIRPTLALIIGPNPQCSLRVGNVSRTMLAAKRAIAGPGLIACRRVGQLQVQLDIAAVASSADRVHEFASCFAAARGSGAAIIS
jgi:hypothetical protein